MFPYLFLSSNSKFPKFVEDNIYLLISIVCGWIPALLIGLIPLTDKTSFFIFNFNSLAVYEDGKMGFIQGLLIFYKIFLLGMIRK
jgi:hypothetical protein